jgi:pyruvate dehydrogenase E1 component
MTRSFFDDQDPAETREWLDSLASIIEHEGPERASWLLDRLTDTATELGIRRLHLHTPYLNTIAPDREEPLPGDMFMERRIRSLVRWNALATVMRATLPPSPRRRPCMTSASITSSVPPPTNSVAI